MQEWIRKRDPPLLMGCWMLGEVRGRRVGQEGKELKSGGVEALGLQSDGARPLTQSPHPPLRCASSWLCCTATASCTTT